MALFEKAEKGRMADWEALLNDWVAKGVASDVPLAMFISLTKVQFGKILQNFLFTKGFIVQSCTIYIYLWEEGFSRIIICLFHSKSFPGLSVIFFS